MKKFDNMSRLVRNARTRAGLTQIKMSAMLGSGNGQGVSNVERSTCSLPVKRVNKLCEITDISKHDLAFAYIKDYVTYIESELCVKVDLNEIR